MTDQELLELAAKAHGFIDDAKSDSAEHGLHRTTDGIFYVVHRRGWMEWDPLTDDGDALRLAVTLGLQIRQYPIYDTPRFAAYVCERKWSSDAERDIGKESIEQYNGDPYAATRRAIVRAAAEIGRGAAGVGAGEKGGA